MVEQQQMQQRQHMLSSMERPSGIVLQTLPIQWTLSLPVHPQQ